MKGLFNDGMLVMVFSRLTLTAGVFCYVNMLVSSWI